MTARQVVDTTLFLCDKCGSVHRQQVGRDVLHAHFANGASYTDPHRADFWQGSRNALFQEIFAVASQDSHTKDHRILDIGCSYGHLLKIFQDGGWDAWGIEASPAAAAFARERMGLTVATGFIEDARLPEASFDVVAMIDTLYYMPDPITVLTLAYALLKKDGLLVMRNINRTSLARIWHLLGRSRVISAQSPLPRLLTGDAVCIPSIAGLRSALKASGFADIAFRSEGPGTRPLGRQRRAAYLVAHTIWHATAKRVLLSPGVLVLARKSR